MERIDRLVALLFLIAAPTGVGIVEMTPVVRRLQVSDLEVRSYVEGARLIHLNIEHQFGGEIPADAYADQESARALLDYALAVVEADDPDAVAAKQIAEDQGAGSAAVRHGISAGWLLVCLLVASQSALYARTIRIEALLRQDATAAS